MIIMYNTMIPLILSGISNMLFTKTNFYHKYKWPIDNYKTLKDNKRIFGDNKTIIGFISMIIFSIIFQIIWGFVSPIKSEWYLIVSNNIINNIIIGFLVGFIYMLFELPNSFMKRRLNIPDGKTKNILSFVIDQIDSLIGVFLILKIFNNMSVYKYFCYLLLGGLTHIIINLILYNLKVRKNL